ncbi:MAG: exodeoxyribonuclease VII large subunit [Treponemataceae bacterium]|nr:exodeoxyribonuclease VII large subunit [Treponemataceae bacterium]
MDDFSAVSEGNKNKAISVSQLNQLIKDILEGSFPLVFVEGEISNLKPSSAGHIYFTLKDENSAISAAIFKFQARNVSIKLRDGMKVRVKGSVSVYTPRGSYQITVKEIEEIGQGNIFQILEERKRRLAAEGLFDSNRKKRIPLFPNVVGVVSSENGAGTKDILKIMHNRNEKINIIVFPCPVQGNEAAVNIARQIKTANDYDLCDVLIVGRGGGALEDLLPFSEECVVRAVAQSHIPVISAVGHEIDVAICDYAADRRASTPSNAAEIVTSPSLREIQDRISSLEADLYREISKRIDNAKSCMKSFTIENMEMRFLQIKTPYVQKIDDEKNSIIDAMQNILTKKKHELSLAINSHQALDPKSILSRGYSLVYDKESGKIIKNINQVKEKQKIEISVSDGKFEAEVK